MVQEYYTKIEGFNMMKKILLAVILVSPIVYLWNKLKRGVRKETVALEKINRDMRKTLWK